MLEKSIETRLVREVKKLGGIAVKNNGPGNESMPDRTCYFPGALCCLVELKRPGQKITAKQKLKLLSFEQRGFNCFVVDSVYEVDCFIQTVKNLLSAKV